MTHDAESTVRTVNPWFARLAVLLILIHILVSGALVSWGLSGYMPPEGGYRHPMGWLVVVLVRFVYWVPYVTILLSGANWFHRKAQRTWKDAGLVALAVVYTFVIARLIYFFVVSSVYGPI